MKTPSYLFGMSLLLLMTSQARVFAANVGPRIEAPKHALIKACLAPIEPKESGNYFSKNLSWSLTCSLDEFRQQLQNDRLINTLPPHIKLLAAQKLFEEFLAFRAKYFTTARENSVFVREGGFFWSPEPSESKLGPIETDIEAFRNANAAWRSEIIKLLEPLLKSSGKTTSLNEYGSFIFFEEAAFLWAQFLAASARYDNLHQELLGRLNFLLKSTRLRDEIHKIIFEVIETHPQGSESLKPLMIQSLSYLDALTPRQLKNEHLDLWIRRFKLAGPPKNLSERNEILLQIRKLWVLFPSRDHKVALRKLSIDLEISKYFVGPSARQMTLNEILIHADRQNRILEGEQALNSVNQVLKLDSTTYNTEELWNALDLHVRLLRIMDQRHRIAGVLNAYIAKGHFLDIPTKETDRIQFFKRLYAIGRWQWSYTKTEIALSTFDRIISLNRAWGTDHELAPSYYVRARIMEQSGDRKVARLYFEEAIQELQNRNQQKSDLYEDLLWRRLFNEFDRAVSENSYTKLKELIDELKPFSKRDEDGDRWIFWKAVVYKAAGETENAIEFFKRAYQHTPLSYYSVVSGLELYHLEQKAPQDWKLPDAGKYWLSDRLWTEPSFGAYFNKTTLKPSSLTEISWARVYGLASIGFFQEASRHLSELERRAYSLSASRKGRTQNTRRSVIQNIAWLRLAAGDQIGSLRMGELARIAFSGKVEDHDLAYLYPLPFKEMIFEAAEAQKIDPWHAISLIRQESAFNPNARSIANALGLMQVIPPVAIDDAKKLGIENFEPENLLAPSMAVRIGSFHLSQLFTHFESSLIASTAGYNAGRPPVYSWLKHYSHPIPYVFIERISFAETRKYVRSIVRNYLNYSRAYSKGEINYETLFKMPLLMPGEAVISPEDTP